MRGLPRAPNFQYWDLLRIRDRQDATDEWAGSLALHERIQAGDTHQSPKDPTTAGAMDGRRV
jgi:hypothetical protein